MFTRPYSTGAEGLLNFCLHLTWSTKKNVALLEYDLVASDNMNNVYLLTQLCFLTFDLLFDVLFA